MYASIIHPFPKKARGKMQFSERITAIPRGESGKGIALWVFILYNENDVL